MKNISDKKVALPVFIFLIEGGKELVLVDTGMAWTERADKYHHGGSYQPEGMAIHEQLAKIGLLMCRHRQGHLHPYALGPYLLHGKVHQSSVYCEPRGIRVCAESDSALLQVLRTSLPWACAVLLKD